MNWFFFFLSFWPVITRFVSWGSQNTVFWCTLNILYTHRYIYIYCFYVYSILFYSSTLYYYIILYTSTYLEQQQWQFIIFYALATISWFRSHALTTLATDFEKMSHNYKDTVILHIELQYTERLTLFLLLSIWEHGDNSNKHETSRTRIRTAQLSIRIIHTRYFICLLRVLFWSY